MCFCGSASRRVKLDTTIRREVYKQCDDFHPAHCERGVYYPKKKAQKPARRSRLESYGICVSVASIQNHQTQLTRDERAWMFPVL
jgi:hypothetical protein